MFVSSVFYMHPADSGAGFFTPVSHDSLRSLCSIPVPVPAQFGAGGPAH